ncbi:MAG: hypothetical protein Q9227_001127 [Pyrenula ochraceoflavens]
MGRTKRKPNYTNLRVRDFYHTNSGVSPLGQKILQDEASSSSKLFRGGSPDSAAAEELASVLNPLDKVDLNVLTSSTHTYLAGHAILAEDIGVTFSSEPSEGERATYFRDSEGAIGHVTEIDEEYRYSSAKSTIVPSPIIEFTHAIIPCPKKEIRPDWLFYHGCYFFDCHRVILESEHAVLCQWEVAKEMRMITVSEEDDRERHKIENREQLKIPAKQVFGNVIDERPGNPNGAIVNQVDVSYENREEWQDRLGWAGHLVEAMRKKTHRHFTVIIYGGESNIGSKTFDWSHERGQWTERGPDLFQKSGLPKYARSHAWLLDQLKRIENLRFWRNREFILRLKPARTFHRPSRLENLASPSPVAESLKERRDQDDLDFEIPETDSEGNEVEMNEEVGEVEEMEEHTDDESFPGMNYL